jgi:hypothetical protein
MTITITPEQRDALYELILVNLSGIGDVWIAVSQEDYDAADRLGRAFSDDLRLVLDDLGWGEGGGEPVELRTPPDVLRRVFKRLLDTVANQREAEQAQRIEARQNEHRSKLVTEACARVLAGLDEEPRQA